MARVAVVYPHTHMAGWGVTLGMVETLKRLGHDVIVCPTPMAPQSDKVPQHVIDRLKSNLPPFEEMSRLDAIFVSGPEHIAPWVDAVWGSLEWRNLQVPRASFYHESSDRADGGQFDFDALGWVATHHFFPAAQDADFYDQEQFFVGRSYWSPLAVDTQLFTPQDDNCCPECGEGAVGLKRYKPTDIGFIGSIYGPRASFLNALGNFNHPPINLGQCTYQTIHGVDIRRSMEMMAADIRSMKIFFNLPSLSLLLVAKVFEVMATGTFLLTPLIPVAGGANRNMTLFENGKELVYYRAGNVAQTAETLKYWLHPDQQQKREEIALAGMLQVHKEHSLEKRLSWALEKMGVGVMVQ